VSHADPRRIGERLSHSQILRDYQRAFSEATGLPLGFRPVGTVEPGPAGSTQANPFCVQIAATEEGCRLCTGMQEQLTTPGTADTRSAECPAGLTDSAVPVRIGPQTIGFLHTGQVALGKLTRGRFQHVMKWLSEGTREAEWQAIEKAFFESPRMSRAQYDAMLRLLEVFAQHLALVAEQVATQEEHGEPPLVQRARQFIEEHQGEDIGLNDVARAVHASTFHFCKMFKKATGMTFTHYLSLVRVSKAKRRLANPQLRISEIAYEVGINSLTHFNRMFRKLAGESPTTFRVRMLGENAAAGSAPVARG